MERYSSLHRKTNETEVTIELCLDGGERSVSTGVGFFDHMLTAFAVHGNFGLKVNTVGDWEVDCHHTVEDTGIVLGKAFAAVSYTHLDVYKRQKVLSMEERGRHARGFWGGPLFL